MKNAKLKYKIFEAGLTQRKVAKETKIPETHLSMHIHGKMNLDPVQKAKIAKMLNLPQREIFAEDRC